MERESGIFYKSFYDAISELPLEEQAIAYDAVMKYMFYGEIPEDLTGAAKSLFIMAKPQIDANNKRRENGKKGGRPKTEAEPKQNQTETEVEPNVNVNVNDNVNVNKKESIAAAKAASVPSKPKPVKRKRAQYGWVKLTDDEMSRLYTDHDPPDVDFAITYVDESAQGTGNKNRWKDWNLVVRKAIRERWGRNGEDKQAVGQNTVRSWNLPVKRL